MNTKMKKELFRIFEMACLLVGGVLIGTLLSFGRLEKQYNSSPPIELQHELMTIDGNWYYCPYCGEKLEENKCN